MVYDSENFEIIIYFFVDFVDIIWLVFTAPTNLVLTLRDVHVYAVAEYLNFGRNHNVTYPITGKIK